jgi:hypothetical protein
MMIDNWECVEHYPGQSFVSREATFRDIGVIADVDGIEIEESYSGYSGARGRYFVPPNVLMWLVAVVR